MHTELYLKLAALAAILITALVYPVVSAFALTGAAAWHLRDHQIREMALVQKILRLLQLTPPGLKAQVLSGTTNLKARLVSSTRGLLPSVRHAQAQLALPAPDAVPMAHTTVPKPDDRSQPGWNGWRRLA